MHDAISRMEAEHDAITRMLQVIRSACTGILDGGPVDAADFRSIIDFLRRYADRHHHGKEERFLFPAMTARLGRIGDAMITHGMLVEHDLGRSHVKDLEDALEKYAAAPSSSRKLDILASAMGYATLLARHIEKENEVVYPLAERTLDEAAFRTIDDSCRAFDEQEEERDASARHLALLERLERKYPAVMS